MIQNRPKKSLPILKLHTLQRILSKQFLIAFLFWIIFQHALVIRPLFKICIGTKLKKYILILSLLTLCQKCKNLKIQYCFVFLGHSRRIVEIQCIFSTFYQRRFHCASTLGLFLHILIRCAGTVEGAKSRENEDIKLNTKDLTFHIQ